MEIYYWVVRVLYVNILFLLSGRYTVQLYVIVLLYLYLLCKYIILIFHVISGLVRTSLASCLWLTCIFFKGTGCDPTVNRRVHLPVMECSYIYSSTALK